MRLPSTPPVGFVLLFCAACSAESGSPYAATEGAMSMGPPGIPGSSAGGANGAGDGSGDSMNGDAAASGGANDGDSMDGDAAANGGANIGGANNSGAVSGGVNSGGVNSGDSMNGGGAANGGADSGGAANGGAANGGADSASIGGSVNGGADSGGAANGGAAADPPDAVPELEEIHFHGRWDVSTPGRAVTVNSGSYLEAVFEVTAEGGELVANFDTSLNTQDVPTLTWRLDDEEWQEAPIAMRLPLATQLSPGQYALTLMVRGMAEALSRWSPPLNSSTTFLNLELSGGELVPSERPDAPRIEFLGDSITEGVAVFRDRSGKTGQSWRADARLAYASQTGLALDADYRQVGFGRLGLLIEGNGGVPPAAESFNWFFADTPRDDWQPDVVVLNQGTVDRDNPDNAGFSAAYGTLLDRIREAYPAADILALRPFGGFHAEQIATEVSTRRDAGDLALQYVDTTGWLNDQHYTDGIHPNPEGGIVVRDRLLPIIEPLL